MDEPYPSLRDATLTVMLACSVAMMNKDPLMGINAGLLMGSLHYTEKEVREEMNAISLEVGARAREEGWHDVLAY